jgi:anti-sigma regulatory factor (Ser/Thr protein kinase)
MVFPQERKGEIHISLKAKEDKLKLTISDSGIDYQKT